MAISRKPTVTIHPTTYQYKPIGDEEIRLLILYPAENGDQESRLQGELKTFRLTSDFNGSQDDISDEELDDRSSDDAVLWSDTEPLEAPAYEALSYTWGGDSDLLSESGSSALSEFLQMYSN